MIRMCGIHHVPSIYHILVRRSGPCGSRLTCSLRLALVFGRLARQATGACSFDHEPSSSASIAPGMCSFNACSVRCPYACGPLSLPADRLLIAWFQGHRCNGPGLRRSCRHFARLVRKAVVPGTQPRFPVCGATNFAHVCSLARHTFLESWGRSLSLPL